MGLLNTLFRSVTWWDSQTINTQLYTWRRGVKVGEDDQGNRFYETKNKKRRWVIFNGDAEASRVSADWHGWLHHTFDAPPSQEPMAHNDWEKPHQENLTGSDLAYAPPGSMRHGKSTEPSDYEAWQP